MLCCFCYIAAHLIISVSNDSNHTMKGEDDHKGHTATRESNHAAMWDQVAANQPPPTPSDVNKSPPEALFHLLDKTLLLKQLREHQAGKSVNIKV
jgi:hypothetical protein